MAESMAEPMLESLETGDVNAVVESSKKRMVCFGSKNFKLTNMNEYFERTKEFKTWQEMKQFKKENPYYDIFEITISSCYDIERKEFYNHVCGMIGNCGGDHFWTSEYSLEVLRARGVPEYHIPKFLKNHKEIETRFLAGEDYSDLLNQLPPNFNKSFKTGYNWGSFTYILGGDNRDDPDLYDPEEGKQARIAELEFIITGFKNILANPEIKMTADERADLEERLKQKEKEKELLDEQDI